ncbi:hypothetical protein Patl1_24454 [Pistacia atlantica]|uniref:Uncharacterized protein n=1 Tax=Pistacia atlantica TaxID=434234 RepID=A0ACC0ZZ93_9ROSI|nr:hypothetical protein Patl1_24454 [Pistacia atlantica]
MLKNTRNDVQVKVTDAKVNVEEIKQNVKDWQTTVNNTITEAERLIQEKEDNPGCFKQDEKFDSVSYPTIPLKKNFDKLRDDVLKLRNARGKVQRKVEEAKNNVEEIEEDVKKWLEDVDSIIVKADDLIKNQSSIGTDRKTRYQKSKAASELMEDKIDPLLQQEVKFDRVSYPTIPLEKNFDKLRDDVSKLKNARLKVQCKITEAKNNVEEITEDVTETPATKKIQTVIANKLGLKFKDAMEDESQRASKLYSRMEKRNILLIIDNIWGELDLKIVGIPSIVDRGRNKILMTTRNVDVLEKMGSTKNLGMGILNEKEAWSLFKKMAGNYYKIWGWTF